MIGKSKLVSALLLAAFGLGLPAAAEATAYHLNAPLDKEPAEAEVSDSAAVSLVPGRLKDQQGLLIREGGVSWTLPEAAQAPLFLEVWLKHHAWDAATEVGFTLLELRAGEQVVSLHRPAGRPVLELRIDDRPVQSHAIYNWVQQPWMTRGANDKDLWHYINLGLDEAGRVTLTIDGFPVQKLGDAAPIAGTPDRVTLLGGPGTAFSMLHVIGSQQPAGEDLRNRYRAMYLGQLTLRPNTVTVPMIDSAPTVDGRPGDPQWRQAARLANLTSLRQTDGRLVKEDLTVDLAYDGQRLYMAFNTPYEGTLNTNQWGEHDSPMWREEAFEIFLLPPWTGQPDYKQLAANPHGDKTDLYVFDDSWNGRWDWHARMGDGRWTAEFQATFAGLDMPHPGDLDIWNLNILNTEANAAWSWAKAYHDIGSFGILRFEKDAPAIRPGRYELTDDAIRAPMQFHAARAPRDLTLTMEVYEHGVMLPAAVDTRELSLTAGETRDLTLEAPRHGLAAGKIIVSIRDGETELYYHSIDFPTAPAALREGGGDEPVIAQVETKATEDMSDAERAYARTWTAEELGEELKASSEWQNNRIGLDEDVPAPWEPIRVEGQTIALWGRTYEYDNSILPVRITTQGRPLLAEAPYFALTTKGETLEFRDAAVRIEPISDSLVRVHTESVVGPYTLRLQTDYEFDGMGKIQMTLLSPDGVEPVDGFRLVFPLRAEQSTLFHWSTPTSGHPPYTDAGAVPEEGIELDLLRHLAWLGNESVGFTWFTESLENWQLRDEEQIQVVTPVRDGRRDFVIKLADRAFDLQQPWTLVFGIQATPMRPRPADFRWLGTPQATDFPWRWGDGEYYIWQSTHAEAAREQIQRVHDKGEWFMPVSSLQFYGRFRYFANDLGELDHPGLMNREVMLWGPLWQRTTLSPGLPAIPQRHTASGNWHGQKFQPRNPIGGGLTRFCPASPFQDYYIWRLKELVDETGLSAIYLDQTMAFCSNAHHGCGYVDYKGEWAPRYTLFDDRQMLKRIRRVLQDGGIADRPLVRWHSSNQIIVPVLSFADVFWDGENYAYGPLKVFEFYSKILPEDRLRAQHTGIQFGFAPDLLPQLSKTESSRNAPSPASVRDMVGLFMVHDGTTYPAWVSHSPLLRFLQNKRLEFPLDQMEVIRYWDDDPRLQVDAASTRFIFHFKNDQALLVLFNWSDEPTAAPVRLHLEELGLSAGSSVRDAATGQLLSETAASFDVPLLPRDLRLVQISSE